MCLTVGNNIALVAKKDIVVYKQLRLDWHGTLVTPYQRTRVELNSTLKAEGNCDYEWKIGEKTNIENGFVHAYTRDTDSLIYYATFKAIIKEGTTYYAQDDLSQIAARELYITDEEVTDDVVSPDMDEICKEYLEAVFSNPGYRNQDGVYIGYYKLSDGTYMNPLNEFDHYKAVGIVAFFQEDGTPAVVDFVDMKLPSGLNSPRRHKHAIFDYANQDIIMGCEAIDGYKYQATIPCKSEEHEWYLGDVSEMKQVVMNAGIINASIQLTKIGKLIAINTIYLTSTPVCNLRLEMVNVVDGHTLNSHYFDSMRFNVRLLCFLRKKK